MTLAGLVPEVVIELHPARSFSQPDDVEVWSRCRSRRAFTLRIAEHRDDDVRAEAMHRMRRRQVGLRLGSPAFDHLVQAWFLGSVAQSIMWRLELRTPGTIR